jgi:hypothetical protein
MRRLKLALFSTACAIAGIAGVAHAQYPFQTGRPGTEYTPGHQGSPNIKVLSHLPLGGYLHVAEIDVEEELARPYVYVAKRFHPTGVDIIQIADPTKPKVIWEWRIDDSELTQGSGGLEVKYFKTKGRYYLVLSTQFQQGGPHVDLCAVVFDVSGLPDTKKVREVRRLTIKDIPGGCHEIYTYKHSDGRALLVTTTTGPDAHVYDMDRFLAGEPGQGLIGKIPITTPETPKLLFSLAGVQGVTYGHTFTPTPDGAYAVTETEYQGAPLRIFDLRPGQEGKAQNIDRPIAFWTANYRNLAHNHEVRWPYVFVSAYEDGLQVFNMMDPYNPFTVGYFDTYDGPHQSRGINNVNMGAWGVDIRNTDGLIVVSDMMTGFWAFKMDGFSGWNGAHWGMPNISSVQDWDNGPTKAEIGVPVRPRTSGFIP